MLSQFRLLQYLSLTFWSFSLLGSEAAVSSRPLLLSSSSMVEVSSVWSGSVFLSKWWWLGVLTIRDSHARCGEEGRVRCFKNVTKSYQIRTMLNHGLRLRRARYFQFEISMKNADSLVRLQTATAATGRVAAPAALPPSAVADIQGGTRNRWFLQFLGVFCWFFS